MPALETAILSNTRARKIVAIVTALAMLLVGRVISDEEFIEYLKEAIADV